MGTDSHLDERIRPVVTVRYHEEGGTYWAEAGSWSGAAAVLSELRALAREGAEFTHGGEYRSRVYFEITDTSRLVMVDPVATEEFWPVEKTNA